MSSADHSDKPSGKKKFSDVFPTPESFQASLLKHLEENPEENNITYRIFNDPEIQKKLKDVKKIMEDSGINERIKEIHELQEREKQENPK